jgi:hypothetical protein
MCPGWLFTKCLFYITKSSQCPINSKVKKLHQNWMKNKNVKNGTICNFLFLCQKQDCPEKFIKKKQSPKSDEK